MQNLLEGPVRDRTDGEAHPAPVQMRRERDLAVPGSNLAVNSTGKRSGFALRCGAKTTTAKLLRSPTAESRDPAIRAIRVSAARRRTHP
ncbi:hypothetical protein ABZT49_04365, partial [Methylobacterium sp. EM32]|uniref:hypothetical protein n=1 Tax=Methylobacterium sp. EM32 TaxID=3163481 RepID=UPI0033B18A54